MALNVRAQKLTQPELGILYVETQVAFGVQQVLTQQEFRDHDKIDLHQMISAQKPDIALISLGLSGVVLANYLLSQSQSSQDDDFQILVTELKHISISTVERYGRVWIDAREHDIFQSEEDDLALLQEAPEILNAFGSVYEELEAYLDESGFVHHLISLLGYQSYAQADLADQYLDMIQAKRLPHGDPIPLPLELQD